MKGNTTRNETVKNLRDINLEDIYSSLGITNSLGRRLLDPLFSFPALKFAKIMERFDHLTQMEGLRASSLWLLDRFKQKWTCEDISLIPSTGPVLLLSNHPGMTDTLGLFAAIPRADLKILAFQRPFLKALKSFDEKLILVLEGRGLNTLKPALDHLAGGGALLTFPAGKIEPDPGLNRWRAEKSREHWNKSTGLFRRLIPGLPVFRLEIEGVNVQNLRSWPALKLWRNKEAREKVFAVLQLLQMLYLPGKWRLNPVLRTFKL